MVAAEQTTWPESPSAPELAPEKPAELSGPEARRALARAVITIGRAADPHAAFIAEQEAIAAAVSALGREFDATAFLESCGVAAERLARLEHPSNTNDTHTAHALPYEAAQQLCAIVKERYCAAAGDVTEVADVTIDDVTGSSTEGFDVTYRIDGNPPEAAFALPYRGGWVFAPGPVGVEDLDDVTASFRRHFDLLVALRMHMGGADDAGARALRRARNLTVPLRTLWPSERDPRGLCDDYPLVFVMRNDAGNRRTFYCGYDPVSGEAEPYDFE